MPESLEMALALPQRRGMNFVQLFKERGLSEAKRDTVPAPKGGNNTIRGRKWAQSHVHTYILRKLSGN